MTLTLIATHALAIAIGWRITRLDLFRPEMLPWPHPPNTPRTEESEDQ